MKKELHVLSTGSQPIGTIAKIAGAIHAHIDFIHIREKTWTAKDHVNAIEQMTAKGVPLEKIIVNDRVDVAVAMKTGGVQLAHHSLEVARVRESFPLLKIGCSVHSVEEAVKAQEAGADYFIYGHIFDTASKPDLKPRGVGQLDILCREVKLPVIAIGGIKPGDTAEVLETGVAGIAVMSGVFRAEDPFGAVKMYRDKLGVKEEENATSL
ncbi:thiazole tautomerase TenI [Bacillus sp. Marseille-Q3570]|uniref:thiazole tautomerase TenI n=1 Tax=Bacillus sp. Marseille-Q3570 TaxID=2963522 RepID=UPI0021B7FA43|nr:thiazole tautomerase TenI [Bacillus sp. Marseille-Q3570]